MSKHGQRGRDQLLPNYELVTSHNSPTFENLHEAVTGMPLAKDL
jgi:hypothetical protein